jgi:hypothetical protein
MVLNIHIEESMRIHNNFFNKIKNMVYQNFCLPAAAAWSNLPRTP